MKRLPELQKYLESLKIEEPDMKPDVNPFDGFDEAFDV
jgi:hypothetical protein